MKATSLSIGQLKAGTSSFIEDLSSRCPQTLAWCFGKSTDGKRADTVSYRLLDAIGLAQKWVVRDGNGKKDSLSIRLLSKYAVVAEDDIMSEGSPVYLSGVPADRIFERNLFKLILSGKDDAAAVTLPKETVRKAGKGCKNRTGR